MALSRVQQTCRPATMAIVWACAVGIYRRPLLAWASGLDLDTTAGGAGSPALYLIPISRRNDEAEENPQGDLRGDLEAELDF